MDSAFFRQWRTIQELWKNPLYKNSFFIALGRFADVGFGFFFWTVAARLYSVADVGVATALISSLGLVMAFSRLGFDIAIIRFMPGHDRSAVFSSCLWITAIASIAVSIGYLFIVQFISPEITFIRDYAILFIVFSLVNSITSTTGNAFLSFRRADYRFVQNLLQGSRILLLFPLVSLGSIGIFSAVGIAIGIAALFAFVLIFRFVTISPGIDREFAKETFRFSSLNYVASLLQGHDARIIDNLSSGRIENISHILDAKKVTFAEGSITDRASQSHGQHHRDPERPPCSPRCRSEESCRIGFSFLQQIPYTTPRHFSSYDS